MSNRKPPDAAPCTFLNLKPLDKCIANIDSDSGCEGERGHRLRRDSHSIVVLVGVNFLSRGKYILLVSPLVMILNTVINNSETTNDKFEHRKKY